MSRIRTIKPDFFKHEGLFDAERDTSLPLRLAFAGLWTKCDREGRFQWRPRALKTDIMPYDDIDFSRVLDALTARGFVVRYACQGQEYGYIPSWQKHQVINNREAASTFPDPSECAHLTDASSTREPRVTETHVHAQGEGKGKEGEREVPPLAPQGGDGEDEGPGESIEAVAIEIWNANAERLGLPQAQRSTDQRLRGLRLRLGEVGGIEGWQAMIEIIGKSPHLLGKNDRGWRASLDWVLKPANLTKIMEGNYVRPQTNRPNSIAAGFDDIRASLEGGIEQGDQCGPENSFGLPGLRQSAT